jgi:hypothetical protein
MRPRSLLATSLLLLLALHGAVGQQSPTPAPGQQSPAVAVNQTPSPSPLPPLPGSNSTTRVQWTGRLAFYQAPNDGCWVGSTIDLAYWKYNLASYIDAIGYNPGTFDVFIELPLSKARTETLSRLLNAIGNLNSIVVLTAEPMSGISPDKLTDAVIQVVADVIKRSEDIYGTRVVLRFAHEMNGNWFIWGQRPIAYKAAWLRMTKILRATTRFATTMWAPTEGGQYPYASEWQQPQQRARRALRLPHTPVLLLLLLLLAIERTRSVHAAAAAAAFSSPGCRSIAKHACNA